MKLIHTSKIGIKTENSNPIISKRGIFNELFKKNTKAAIVGLGQDGVQELAKFSEHFKTIGFDENEDKVNLLKNQIDPLNLNEEIGDLQFSSDPNSLRQARLFVITAKPALNEYYKPNLQSLTCSVRKVAKALKKRDHVIFKFTSFPGCIEEVCLPILEKESKLKLNRDFTIGFSPEKFDYQIEGETEESSKNIISSSDPDLIGEYVNIFKKVEGDFIHPIPNIRLTEILNIISLRKDINSIPKQKYA